MSAAAAAAAALAMTGGRHRTASMKEMATKNLETNIDQASVDIQTGDINNLMTYGQTCIKLGRSIDTAIALNAFLSSFHLRKLTLIVKEVYRRKTEELQPSLMLLMLPIKAACKIGWFPDADKDRLLMIAKEVSFGFCHTDKMNIEPSNAHENVSNIVSRFYPKMKVEHILTSFDVKAGYGTFIADFHISLGTTPRQCRDLWLLVAKLDNMDTAACITGPSDVDFLLNGDVVPNRTKNDMEKGPLLPLNVTKMIHYGLNLLQVFGDFDGQYIIALAFMNPVSLPDPSQLQDYLHPVSVHDCEVIEMTSSRISLCCPVSQNRIKTPVKGHLCKHPQCFDYNHFIEVNSTKPTWTCPVCNNPVCNQDIRIDQVFLKILNEVPKDVNDVIISGNGSWTVAKTHMDTLSYTSVATPAVSPGQTQVNVCTTDQAQSTTKFTPPASETKPSLFPGQTQFNVCSTNHAQSATKFTPPVTETKPVLSQGQTQVNVCSTNQAQSATKFTLPASVMKPVFSQGQTPVNTCTTTTTQAKSTSMFTPPPPSNQLRKGGESQSAPNISRVFSTQLPEASVDAMPTGRMRGSLRGDQLEAARLQYLAPPVQPARANEPWSRPPIRSLPATFLMPRAPTNSDTL